MAQVLRTAAAGQTIVVGDVVVRTLAAGDHVVVSLPGGDDVVIDVPAVTPTPTPPPPAPTPTPPPPPDPTPMPAVVVGPAPVAPGPGDAVLAAGDSPARLQQLLATNGRVFLPRGGRWAGNFELSRPGTPQRPAGLFACGDPARPPPLLLGTVDARGVGTALYVTRAGLANLAVVGVEVTSADPNPVRRCDGINIGGAVTGLLLTVHVHHCAQNVIVQGRHRGVLIDGCSSHHAAGPDNRLFTGQGFYLDLIVDRPVVRNTVAWRNGVTNWADLLDLTRNQYRHGFYSQMTSGPPVYQAVAAYGNAACGIEVRNGGDLNVVFTGDNGTDLMVPGGGRVGVRFRDVVCCGARRYWDGGGAWIAAGALDCATTIDIDGLLVVPQPGQTARDPIPPRPAVVNGRPNPVDAAHWGRQYNNAALTLNGVHDPHREIKTGGRLAPVKNLLVARDWPVDATRKDFLWGGDNLKGQTAVGVGLIPPVDPAKWAWVRQYVVEAAEQWRVGSDRTVAELQRRFHAAVGY